MSRLFSSFIAAVWLCLLLGLTAAMRCSNRADVFIDGHVYFVDADCYSRMTRVRMVLEHPATILRHHDFENYPQGTTPHTTAPFDYLIAGLKPVLDAGFWITGNRSSPWAAQTLDLAGAIVSPLMGVLTLIFLWTWSRQLQWRFRGMLLFLCAVSPILVHGTLLGRPDHQSLAIFLMAVALGAEWALIEKSSLRWALVGGAAWGFGLWVTLYEPLVLLSLVLALIILFKRRALFTRNRAFEFGLMLALFAVSIAIEGWRIETPNTTILTYFPNWEKTIGELSRLTPFSPLLFRWVGPLFLAAPLLLAWRARTDRRAVPVLFFLAATYVLTLWQMRWGYFFALAFSIALPFCMQTIRWRWVAWTLFVVGLWPVAQEWDERLYPNERAALQLAEERSDKVLLRGAAESLDSAKKLPILAPWWLSPPLVYWSGQPAVGGSSHESLPGIVDAARFFNTSNPDVAREILRSRQVARVVVYDSDRVLETASTLLAEPIPEKSMAAVLYRHPHSPPTFLKLEYANRAYRVFACSELDQRPR